MKWCKGIGTEVDTKSGRKWWKVVENESGNGGKCRKKME